MAIIVLKKKKLTFIENLYILEVFKGLMITLHHLIRNLLKPSGIMTYQFPEEKKAIPATYRSEHRLMLREDKSIRCTACMLCATVCPAKCIHIEAAEGETPNKEKYPEKVKYVVVSDPGTVNDFDSMGDFQKYGLKKNKSA